MTLLDRVSVLLDERAIPHALIGAAALAAAGVSRSTYDLDLLTGDARVLLPETWRRLQDAAVSVDIRRGDDEDPLGGVIRLEHADERPVDVILAKHAWQTRTVDRARRLPSGPAIVSPPDLVLLKLYAGGTQDLWDIRELLRMPESEEWATAVERELSALPHSMRDRWINLRR
jgi:hypothetical protein